MRTGLLCGLLAVVTAAHGARADFVTIGATHDASIFSGNPNNSNGAGPGLFAGTDGVPQNLRSLIQFNVAGGVPAGSTITAVKLTLTLGLVAGAGETGTRSIELHRLTATWGEGTTESTATTITGTGQGAPANSGDATWTDRFWSSTTPAGWTSAGGDFVAAASAATDVGIATGVAYNWLSTPALVADVQGWLDNPSTNDGWLIRNANETPASRTYRAFWSREASNAALRPQLRIDFTAAPEPIALAPAGILAIALLRKRNRTTTHAPNA